MIYTELTVKASKIAYEAHHGQVDKIGMPYILHPLHLAEQMDDEVSVCVALLHDVVEDTDVTIEDLEKEFPEEVIRPLTLLTHPEGEPYMDYINRVITDPVAKKIKIADMTHNMNEQRADLLGSPEAKEYFMKKYEQPWKVLHE